MAKRIRPLTQAEVDEISVDGTYSVGGVPGLRLRVKGRGRSWVLRRTSNGQVRDIGIGSCAEIDLDRARELAHEMRAGRAVSAPWATRIAREAEEIGHMLTARVLELIEPHLRSAVWQAIEEIVADEAR